MTERRKRGRRVFFVTAYYEEDCLTSELRHEVVVASRRQAKKLIRYVRSRCLEFHGAEILPARQDDIRGTGWTVNRRGPVGQAESMTGRGR
jgi:hypothetical protein